MEVLTSKNRMSATTFLSLYFGENVITGLLYKHNDLAATQCSEDFLITYCLILTFIVFCAFPLFIYFKDSNFRTLLRILDNIQCIGLYTAHVFNTLFGLYTILNEVRQLQIYDDQFQQPGTQKVLTQIPPPLDEFITKVREQLTVFPSAEWTPPIQDIQQECCKSQVFEAEQFFFVHSLQIHRMYMCTIGCL